jgi:hypothetical protein
MNTTREQRKMQLETMKRTTSGRERIIEAYRRVTLSRGHLEVASRPYQEMIDAILQAQYPDEQRNRRF